jgi:hypothetical protein
MAPNGYGVAEIETKAVQTQVISIYYTEHVSTYFRSSSGSKLLYLKHNKEGIKAHKMR